MKCHFICRSLSFIHVICFWLYLVPVTCFLLVRLIHMYKTMHNPLVSLLRFICLVVSYFAVLFLFMFTTISIENPVCAQLCMLKQMRKNTHIIHISISFVIMREYFCHHSHIFVQEYCSYQFCPVFMIRSVPHIYCRF